MNFEPTFRCRCKEPKTNRVILDGGSEGNYVVELCPRCYEQQNWKFLIKKEIITELDNPGRLASNSVTELVTSG